LIGSENLLPAPHTLMKRHWHQQNAVALGTEQKAESGMLETEFHSKAR